MTVEEKLSAKLRRFSRVDIVFVKLTYFVVGLLLVSLFQGLQMLHWGYFLTLMIIAMVPLYIHMFGHGGTLCEKADHYLKTNNPSNQALLFLSMMGFSGFLASLFPVLAMYDWKVYVVLIILLAIKPMTKTIFW